MQALIVADLEHRATPLQTALIEVGCDCPRTHLLGLAEAQSVLRGGKTFDLVISLCSENYGDALRAITQLRACTQTKLVAAGATAQVNEILNLIRAGASDYLDLYGNLQADLTAILTRLKTDRADELGRTVCILASSGGCGASTLAANLATVLGTAAKPACLIDLNFRGGDLATLLNVRPRHTLVDLCCQGQRLDEVMFQQSLTTCTPALKLLAAPPLLTRFDGIDLDNVSAVLRLARSAFSQVVVDLEDSSHPEQSQALRICDVLLMTLRLDFPSLLRARRLIDDLREVGFDASRIRLVANRVGSPKALSERHVQEAFGMPVFHCLPEDEAVMLASVNVGSPAVLEQPSAKISKSYRKLAEMLSA